jgi:hypothetical protein
VFSYIRLGHEINESTWTSYLCVYYKNAPLTARPSYVVVFRT